VVVANTSRRPVAGAVYTIHPEVEESQAEPWAGESRSFRLLVYQLDTLRDCTVIESLLSLGQSPFGSE
jgi:hypothetical protein